MAQPNPPGPRTFKALFDGLDYLGRRGYETHFLAFRTDRAPPDEAALRDTIVAADSSQRPQDGCFFGVVHTSGHEGEIETFTGVKRYAARLGSSSPYDGRVYAFRGEVSAGHGQVQSVEFLESWCAINTGVFVLDSYDAVRTALLADMDREVMGPFTVDDTNVRAVVTRNITFLPSFLYELTLSADGDPLSPRDLFLTVYARCEDANDVAGCAPLLDHLVVAITLRPGRNTGTGPRQPINLISAKPSPEFNESLLPIAQREQRKSA